MISKVNPMIKKTYPALEALKHNEKVRRQYEALELALIDEALKMQSAKEKGIEKGRLIGIEEGKAIGIEKGKSIGIEEGKSSVIEEGVKLGVLKTAKNLISLGMDDKSIMKATGLDADTLNTLRDSISPG